MSTAYLRIAVLAIAALLPSSGVRLEAASPQKTSCAGKPWKSRDFIAKPSEVDEQPLLASYVNPYPDSCPVADGLEGYVVFIVVVDGEGNIDPRDAKLVSTDGPDFTRIALDGFSLTRFWPACLDGEPVATRIKYRVRVDCKP
jgi:hypothetical protein